MMDSLIVIVVIVGVILVIGIIILIMRTQAQAKEFVANTNSDSGKITSPKEYKSNMPCDLIIRDIGKNKIEVIKAVQAITQMSLQESTNLLERVPVTVIRGIDASQAEDSSCWLVQAGATVDILPSDRAGENSCPHCGAVLRGTAKFCGVCGKGIPAKTVSSEAPAATADLSKNVEMLEKLGTLKEKGLISEEEYNEQKKKLLGL